ncbi:DUF1992 domain-containing protein [Nocardioides sp.]|uniref:DnaJ family domain-containing protein n=1 Tax=Nocardioides sp. TaxID=35761 RepID=UPI002ECFD1FC
MVDRPDRTPERDRRTGQGAAAARMRDQHSWVDQQIRQAMARGEFDDLPGAGKPIKNLGTQHDPDWWVKQLVEREKITGVLPPALQLRKDDLELDDRLDRITSEREVRRELEDFNKRIIAARRQLEGGPPVITPTRDVEAEIRRWRERRQTRHTDRQAPSAPEPTRRRGRRRR